jgi:hypothetical protein
MERQQTPADVAGGRPIGRRAFFGVGLAGPHAARRARLTGCLHYPQAFGFDLRDGGVLTDDEFERAKARVLA